MGGDDGEHRDRESDIGGSRDGPATERSVTGAGGEGDEDQRRRDHAADGGGNRQRGAGRIAKVTGDELAFELQAHDEEEDRQQAVGSPAAQREVQVQTKTIGTEPKAGQCVIRRRPRRVGPHQCDRCGCQQDRAADGLLVQDVDDTTGLRPRAAGEQPSGHSKQPIGSAGRSTPHGGSAGRRRTPADDRRGIRCADTDRYRGRRRPPRSRYGSPGAHPSSPASR